MGKCGCASKTDAVFKSWLGTRNQRTCRVRSRWRPNRKSKGVSCKVECLFMEHVPNENACKNYEDWTYLLTLCILYKNFFVHIRSDWILENLPNMSRCWTIPDGRNHIVRRRWRARTILRFVGPTFADGKTWKIGGPQPKQNAPCPQCGEDFINCLHR